MSKFKKSPAAEFISGAPKPAAGALESLTIRIRPDVLERLRALAYLKRETSQRQIIETALQAYFEQHPADLARALELWRKLE